jgi:AcrR family transcriptional regulator
VPSPADRLSLLRFLRKQPSQTRSRVLVDAVVDAFDDLLRRSSNEEAVTLEALVERAGVGIGSFYEYFSNKEALIGVLVAKATKENFHALLDRIDESGAADLTTWLRTITTAVAETYLSHPARTRILMVGIGRLSLMPMIVRERDRFACELATRLRPFLPNEPLPVLERTVLLACDACMGITAGELHRESGVDLAGVTEEMFVVCMGIVRMRHAVD